MATTGFDPDEYALLRASLRTLSAGEALAPSHCWNPGTSEFPFNAFNLGADTTGFQSTEASESA